MNSVARLVTSPWEALLTWKAHENRRCSKSNRGHQTAAFSSWWDDGTEVEHMRDFLQPQDGRALTKLAALDPGARPRASIQSPREMLHATAIARSRERKWSLGLLSCPLHPSPGRLLPNTADRLEHLLLVQIPAAYQDILDVAHAEKSWSDMDGAVYKYKFRQDGSPYHSRSCS